MKIQVSIETFVAHIYMAGDILQAKQAIREFVIRGLCVTIEPLEFIYTGGEESGFRVGLINYPKYPSTPQAITRIAEELAEFLKSRIFQQSYSIVCTDKTVWRSTREHN
jgi:hypothetical protein